MTNFLRQLSLALAVLVAACGSSNNGVPDGAPADSSIFGTPCTTSDQCLTGGACVDGPGGQVCTYGCAAGCPATWECRVTKVDGSLQSLCVPPRYDICTPCENDAACAGGACILAGGDHSCLPGCGGENTCPTGYTCGADPANTHQGQFCIPDTKSCSCTSASSDGQIRTCSNANANGMCQGLETCHPAQGGWVGCSAPAPQPEVCDGVDNNCDGLVDENTDGQPCANSVSGIGSCPGVTLCTGLGGLICQAKTPTAEACNGLDDDCDGMVDEGFANLGTVCSAGVGGCQRFGVIRCDAAHTGTECSATPTAPVAELCNNIDDDCDGKVDETFPTLGQSCTVGIGQCARQGQLVCNGVGLSCAVTAGMPSPEICDGLDNNCNGQIDEGFKNQVTGLYDQDGTCGSCLVNCTTEYNVANGSGHCVVASRVAACAMTCAANAFNLDGAVADGCEFILDATAIYVSTDDAAAADDATCGLGPVGTGAGQHPCKTITHGLARAVATNRANVLVANGTYDEAVALVSGKNLLGGYRPDNWARDVASTDTVIDAFAFFGANARTVSAVNITAATTFEGFVVYGAVDELPRGNSYAIYVSGSTSSLTIKNNTIFGGVGGPGSNGTNGADGANGASGSGRNPNLAVGDSAYDAEDANAGSGECDVANNRQIANGGVTTCGGVSVRGGNGGGNQCPVMSYCDVGSPDDCLAIHSSTYTAISGSAGATGGVGGGAAGAGAIGGADSVQIYSSTAANYNCYLPDPGNTYGLDGSVGGDGTHGAAAGGCSGSLGMVSGGDWIGGTAGIGATGGNGGGGGGGGAGGGGKCEAIPGNPAHSVCLDGNGKDTLGGHGGGGGAAWCGGGGGSGATTGGGAFGVYITGGASAPVSPNNTIL